MKIYKLKVRYVSELFIKEKKENSKSSNNIELILIILIQYLVLILNEMKGAFIELQKVLQKDI